MAYSYEGLYPQYFEPKFCFPKAGGIQAKLGNLRSYVVLEMKGSGLLCVDTRNIKMKYAPGTRGCTWNTKVLSRPETPGGGGLILLALLDVTVFSVNENKLPDFELIAGNGKKNPCFQTSPF